MAPRLKTIAAKETGKLRGYLSLAKADAWQDPPPGHKPGGGVVRYLHRTRKHQAT